MEYDMTHKQQDYLKKAIANPYGRVTIITKGDAAPLLIQGWIARAGSSMFTFEITDRGIELLGLDVAQVRANQEAARTPAAEPQTAAYQAAVDNVYDEMRRAAISIQNSWNLESGDKKYDRWDYEMELEAAIEAEVFHASHSYRLYS